MVLAAIPVFSQVKYEKESRIRTSEVPSNAIEFINSVFPERKVRWYYEENLSGHSIEAKVRKNGHLFSIEFDTTGAIEDAEQLIAFKEIPEASRQKIIADLDDRFVKFRTQRVQIQFVGDQDDLGKLLREEGSGERLVKSFEIVIRGKDKSWAMFEFHYAEDGSFLDLSSILLKNSDHLEF